MDFSLTAPIWVLYLRDERGFSMAQITFMEVPLFLLIVFAEVPTGAVADRYGRRISLLLELHPRVVDVRVRGGAGPRADPGFEPHVGALIHSPLRCGYRASLRLAEGARARGRVPADLR